MNYLFSQPLASLDPTADRILRLERARQARHIILIASESACPLAVREAVGSEFGNIYAEGYPSTRMSQWERDKLDDTARGMAFFRRYADRRYYKGTEYCDFIEALAQTRGAQMFATANVPADEIHVNVQPLSGAAANNAVYEAFCEPGDTVMGIELSHGGHLTHGSPFNRSGKRYRIVSYGVDPKTGKLDYDAIIDMARREKPRMIIGGASAYPWAFDWEALRRAADTAGGILFADVAHPAGLIVTGHYPSPIGHAHVVTSTTHKTLCGPRGAIIVTTDPRHRDMVDMAVFPGEQGGPHMHAIAGKAVAFGIALTPQFKELQGRVKENAAAFADAIVKRGGSLCYHGTNSHLFLIDCKKIPSAGNLNGDIASRILDLVGITLNKNTVAGDKSAANPSAIRIGTTWVSQLGMGVAEMDKLADMVMTALSSTTPFDVVGAFGDLGRGKLPLDVLTSVRERVQAMIATFPNEELNAKVEADRVVLYGEPEPHPSTKRYRDLGAVFTTINDGRVDVPVHFGDAAKEEAAATSGQGVCVFDLSANGLFEIYGERATAFLQQLVTCDLTGMQPGEAKRFFMLEGDGKLVADGVLYKRSGMASGMAFQAMSPTPSSAQPTRPAQPNGSSSVADGGHGLEGHATYWLRVPHDVTARVETWLHGHSDGYMLFEPGGDLYRKIDGPVAILNRRANEPEADPLASLFVTGADAPATIAALSAEAGQVPPKSIRDIAINGTTVHVARAGDSRWSLHVARAKADWLLGRVLEASGNKAVMCGLQALEALRTKDHLPRAKDNVALATLVEKFADRFAPTKPYFVGQPAVVELIKPAPRVETWSWEEREVPEDQLRQSCLYAEHLKLTKPRNLVPFAGWKMPVMYTTISEEHRAVRASAGLFDVSHMGVFELTGPHAQPLLDLVTTNFVLRLRPGQSFYSYLLAADGHVLDDVLVYCRGHEHYMMVVNAANADKDWAWINAINEREVVLDRDHPWRGLGTTAGRARIVNLKDDASLGDARRADLALQGRNSLAILQSLTDDTATKIALDTVGRTDFIEITLGGHPVIVARTGYTGEPVGFELYIHPDRAPEIWNAILSRTEFGVVPTGLGARDSTRTEAGFPLYGHELAGPYDIDPREAGYGSFVKRHKPFFVGRSPFLAREKARSREVVRFKLNRSGVRTIHPGAPVVSTKGKVIGHVTSATLVGQRQIGLAIIDKAQARDGARLGIFIPPHKATTEPAMPPKPLADLALGDQVPLAEDATIVCRFPANADEFQTNLTAE